LTDGQQLATVANLLMQAAPDHKGNPGLSVQFQDASGGAVSSSQTTVIAPTASRVATTITPQAEQAAFNAINGTGCSAIVVIQPSTGHTLAIASNAQDPEPAPQTRHQTLGTQGYLKLPHSYRPPGHRACSTRTGHADNLASGTLTC
jgi:hypothetical protein